MNERLPERYRECREVDRECCYNHEECGDRKQRLYVRYTLTGGPNKSAGWWFICHNCAGSTVPFEGFYCENVRDGVAPPRKRLWTRGGTEDNEEVHQRTGEAFTLPRDADHQIPEDVRDWYRRYGVTDHEAESHGFVYSPFMGRLIMPVYDGDTLVAYQARDTGRAAFMTHAKYITIRRKDKDGQPIERHPPVWCLCLDGSERCCVVEDILSAIKVGRCCSAIAALGSPSRPSPALVHKVSPFTDSAIWLDPDKYRCAHSWAARLRGIYGRRSFVIRSELDPKEHTDEYIYQKVMED